MRCKLRTLGVGHTEERAGGKRLFVRKFFGHTEGDKSHHNRDIVQFILFTLTVMSVGQICHYPKLKNILLNNSSYILYVMLMEFMTAKISKIWNATH